MVAVNMPDVNPGRRPEKDFPYFRRLWKSVVFALLVASLLPLAVIGGGLYGYAVSVLEKSVLESLRTEIRDHQRALDRFLRERTADLQLLSSTRGPEALAVPGALEEGFRSLRREQPCFTDLGIIDDRGRHLAYVGAYDLASKNYEETPWFKAVKERGTYISDVFPGFRKEPHVILAVRNKTLAGFWIMRATMDTGFLHDMLSDSFGKRRGNRFLVNPEGVFQTSPPGGGRIMEQSPVRNPERFEGVRIEERGKEFSLATWLESVPWLYVVELDRDEIDAPLKRMRNIGMGIFVLGGILILGTVLLISNSLIARLERDRRRIHLLDHHLRQSRQAVSSLQVAAGFVEEMSEAFSNLDLVLTGIEESARGDLSGEENRREVREGLKQARSQLVRGRAAMERFLKTTQPSLPIIREVRLENLLDEMIDRVHRDFVARRIKIRREYGRGLPPVHSDPSQLGQVFQDLIVHAATAIGKDGVITITGRETEQGVRIGVAHTGLEIRDPRIPLRPDETGTEFSAAAGLLERLGGRLWVTGEIEKGFVVAVEIPKRFRPPEA